MAGADAGRFPDRATRVFAAGDSRRGDAGTAADMDGSWVGYLAAWGDAYGGGSRAACRMPGAPAGPAAATSAGSPT